MIGLLSGKSQSMNGAGLTDGLGKLDPSHHSHSSREAQFYC